MAKLDDIIQELRNELGSDFVAASVVGMDGLAIAGGSVDPEFDATAASARFALVMKLAAKVSGKLQLGQVDDNLVTTDRVFILTRFLGDGSYYWEMAVTKDATLGMVRMLMNEYADRLWNAIPH